MPEWDPKHMKKLLQEGIATLRKEPLVLDLTEETDPITIAGPMYAHIDSLTNQISMVGTPPNRKILFMGCYFGPGTG